MPKSQEKNASGFRSSRKAKYARTNVSWAASVASSALPSRAHRHLIKGDWYRSTRWRNAAGWPSRQDRTHCSSDGDIRSSQVSTKPDSM